MQLMQLMKADKMNLINALSLIIFGLWGFIDVNMSSQTGKFTPLIPVFIGVVLLLFNKGMKSENKVIAHIVVLLTLLILGALIFMTLPKSLDREGLGQYRVMAMILTSSLAFISFIRSFIENRSKKA